MRAVWFSGLLALLLLIGLAVFLAPLQPDVLALQMSFSARRFGEVVHAWGDAGLARFRQHLPWDGALLLAYGFFGYLLSLRSSLFRPADAPAGSAPSPRERWLLPAAALCDALENLLHGWLTAAPRFDVPWLYACAAGLASMKWLLIVSFAAMAAAALMRSRP